MASLTDRLMAHLNAYLRERMDFIAAITTVDPSWAAPLALHQNVILPFWGRVDNTADPSQPYQAPRLLLLLDNIARSEGIRAGGIQLYVEINTGGDKHPSDFGYFVDRETPSQIPRLKYVVSGTSSVRIHAVGKLAISMATTGTQAFYGLLENFLRNSAKHSPTARIDAAITRSTAVVELGNLWGGLVKRFPVIPQGEIHRHLEASELAEIRKKAEELAVRIETYRPLTLTMRLCYDFEDTDGSENLSDFFVRVELHDDMGGWNAEGENLPYLVRPGVSPDILDERRKHAHTLQKLNEIVSGTDPMGNFITQDGRLVEGKWGLKEMRICASFLRGLPISSYQTPPSPQVLQIQGFQAEADEQSMGCVFYVPKVRELLVIGDLLPSGFNLDVARHEGIYRILDTKELSNLRGRGTFTHELVLLDADNDDFFSYFRENIKMFPGRTLFVTGESEKTRQVLEEWESRPEDGGAFIGLKERVISRRDVERWVTESRVSLTTAQGQFDVTGQSEWECLALNVYRHWVEVLSTARIDHAKSLPIVRVYDRSCTDNGDTMVVQRRNNPAASGDIVLDHKYQSESSLVMVDRSNRGLFYTPYSNSAPSPMTKAKNLIVQTSQASEGTAERVRPWLQLVEAALTGIVVIDERLWRSVQEVRIIAERSVSLWSYLYMQNVLVLDIELFKRDGEGSLNPHINYIVPPPQPLDSEVSLTIDRVSWENALQVFSGFPVRPEFLVIHRTILDNQLGGDQGLQQLLAAMGDYRPRRVIVTSGGGKPDHVPPYARYIEFSNLQKYLVDQPDKHLITQMLYALKESSQ